MASLARNPPNRQGILPTHGRRWQNAGYLQASNVQAISSAKSLVGGIMPSCQGVFGLLIWRYAKTEPHSTTDHPREEKGFLPIEQG
jgi:hypothetical protein